MFSHPLIMSENKPGLPQFMVLSTQPSSDTNTSRPRLKTQKKKRKSKLPNYPSSECKNKMTT